MSRPEEVQLAIFVDTALRPFLAPTYWGRATKYPPLIVAEPTMKGRAGGKMKKGGLKGEGASSSKQTGQAMMFNHALGQHILKNPLIVQALVDKVS